MRRMTITQSRKPLDHIHGQQLADLGYQRFACDRVKPCTQPAQLVRDCACGSPLRQHTLPLEPRADSSLRKTSASGAKGHGGSKGNTMPVLSTAHWLSDTSKLPSQRFMRLFPRLPEVSRQQRRRKQPRRDENMLLLRVISRLQSQGPRERTQVFLTVRKLPESAEVHHPPRWGLC